MLFQAKLILEIFRADLTPRQRRGDVFHTFILALPLLALFRSFMLNHLLRCVAEHFACPTDPERCGVVGVLSPKGQCCRVRQ